MKLFHSKKDSVERQKPHLTEGRTKEDDYRNKKLSTDLDKNLTCLYEMMGYTAELKKRDFYLDENKEIKVCFLYVNGLANETHINDTIFTNMFNNYERFKGKIDLSDFDTYQQFLVTVTEMSEAETYGELMIGLLGGDTIFLIDGFKKFYVIGTRKYPERGVESPSTHISVFGPKDSFTENIITNLNLIRRRLKNPNLWLEKFLIGKDSNTDVFMMYLKGIADDKLVTEVYTRLKKIELPNILDSSYVEAIIKGDKFSIFPRLYMTERPDVITANLLEGRVAILVDGTPFVLIAPTTFLQFFMTVEDYYEKVYVATFFRILRMIGFYVAILLPSLYIALTLHHAELLPFQLLLKVTGQRSGLPFPSYAEAIIMSIIFDILREASSRVAKALGNAITTAGALVLGQSAVEAGIISPIMVVIVALTAITTLVIPNYRLQQKVVILKYGFMILASFFGAFGLLIGLLILYTHLCSIRSFGVNYYAPMAPFNFKGQKDSVTRAPLKNMFDRPDNFTQRYKH